MNIHENIKKLREEQGITQVHVAKKLEIPYQTYNNYENGKRTPRPELLLAISKVLNVPIEKFFEEKIYESKNSKRSVV